MVEIEEEPTEPKPTNNSNRNRSRIQLGFSEPIITEENSPLIIAHTSPRWWKDWDGGQLGGRPSWLDPEHLPPKPLICTTCQNLDRPMMFLCQLYAPLDHLPQAFHRSFYVFGCPSCTKTGAATSNSNGGGIRVLRVQLPEDNPYYPTEHEQEDEGEGDYTKHLPSTYNIQLCAVCGQRASGKCPLQLKWFCSKAHQKEYKQQTQHISKKQEQQQETISNNTNANIPPDDSYLPSVYAVSELVVEEEPPSKGNDDNDENDDDDEIAQRPTLFESKLETNDDQFDSDEDLEQEDLNEMVTGHKIDQTSTKDPATNAFYHRIQDRKVPEQCLRYNMQWREQYDKSEKDCDDGHLDDNMDDTNNRDDDSDNYPLWLRSDHQPDITTIPPCPYCNAPRAFEFQLMPQMLSFLHANRKQQAKTTATIKSNNETAKQALLAAHQIIQNSDPSEIPPSFAPAKENAMNALQQELYQDDEYRVDWGVVAIYTCTKSCNNGSSVTAKDGDDVDELGGVYREEFAWVQPALGI